MSVSLDFLAFLEKIPAPLWGVIGVIVGSFSSLVIALVIFVLGDRGLDRRLRMQHEHDRDLKKLEREMLLRKEVYLAAAEAVAAGLMAISRGAHLDLSDQELMHGYVDKAPSIMKVHIIATDETVKTLVHFSNELSEALLTIFERRRSLVLMKQRHDILIGQIDAFTRANSPVLVEQAMQEVDTINASLDPSHRQFALECLRETLRLARLVNPILFSIRKELELPTNEAEILKISDEGAAKALETAVKFLRPPPSSSGGVPPPAA